MKPLSETRGMAPEMLVSLKLAGAIRARVVQKPAYMGAHVGNGLPTETTLIFVVSNECRQPIVGEGLAG
jgi:hypothetical protein